MHEYWSKQLQDSYQHNISFVKYLQAKSKDLQKYLHWKHEKTLQREVRRLVGLRKATNHTNDMRELMNLLTPT